MPKIATAILAAILTGVSCAAIAAQTHTVYGQARVIDGDTLDINGQRIRLAGIDAFEKRQTCTLDGVPYKCGMQSLKAMVSEIADHEVLCEGTSYDRYRRLIAVCHVGDTDLNAFIVRNGWALAYRQFSTMYVADENLAKNTGSGAWAGKFEEPWVWRKSH